MAGPMSLSHLSIKDFITDLHPELCLSLCEFWFPMGTFSDRSCRELTCVLFFSSWSDDLNPPQVIHSLLPLLLETSTESVAEISSNSLERILGPAESDEFLARVYEKLITGCYNILAHHSDPNR